MRFLDIFSAQHDRLLLALQWAHKFDLICASCSCSKIFTDFEHTFQSLELIVWSALALEKGLR